MAIAVGDGHRIARLLPELGTLLVRPLITLERVRVCKRDGRALAEPRRVPDADPSGLGIWQKLMVYANEQARGWGHPIHQQLVRTLRKAGGAGATSLRGIWGYNGAHTPHGDSFWQLRRRAPTVTVIVDTPQRTRRWFELVDQLTRRDRAGHKRDGPGFPRHRPPGDRARRAQARASRWAQPPPR